MSFVYQPTDAQPRVIHADHEVLVVSKPSGLLSVPGRGEDRTDCLIARLRGAFPTVLLVHRLDLDTSGVMVFGLTPHAQRNLSRQFEDRKTKKVYVARLAGRLEPKSGTVDLPLIVDWPNRPKQKVDFDLGRPSQTRFRVLSRDTGKQTTRVALEPVTGRSHQLRVHMMSLQHPILGDDLYGGPAEKMADRLLLHAMDLGFKHPETGERMDFHSEPPF